MNKFKSRITATIGGINQYPEFQGKPIEQGFLDYAAGKVFEMLRHGDIQSDSVAEKVVVEAILRIRDGYTNGVPSENQWAAYNAARQVFDEWTSGPVAP